MCIPRYLKGKMSKDQLNSLVSNGQTKMVIGLNNIEIEVE